MDCDNNTIAKVMSDIDGTLLSFGAPRVSSLVKHTIGKLYRSNIGVHLVTSRTPELTKGLFNDLALGHQLAVTDGGATVLYADTLEVVWRQWLDRELVYKLCCLLSPYAEILCCTAENNPLSGVDIEEKIAKGISNFSDVASIFIVHDQVAVASVRAITASFPVRAHTELYEGGVLYGTQITCTGVDKKSGVQQLLVLSGQPRGCVLAIGDGINDLSLFEVADIKVAMGSAPEELKQVADFVTDTVERDGFVVAMREYGLV